VATTFAAVCTPVGGVAQCSYPSTQVDCAQTGQVCQGTGVCTTPSLCAIPTDGAGFLVYAADGDPSAATVDFDLRAMKVDGTCDQPIASGPEYDLFPSWSRSTGLLAWGGFRGGQARVVVQSVFGGPQRVLDTGPESATAPSLSEDGTLVAFERLDLAVGRSDVYVVPVAGGTPVELAAGTIVVRDGGGNEIGTCPANDAGPVFSTSPAGRFVYFISDRSSTSCAAGAQVTEVWRQAIDVAGAAVGAPERLTTGSAILGRPTVSPDGTAFAYTKPSTPATSFAKVVLHTVATGQERTVIDDSDSEPAFAPAGDALAVKSTRTSSQGELLLVDLATGAVRRRLTTGTIDVATPAFPR
jgi:Tol biopolymer transport system component